MFDEECTDVTLRFPGPHLVHKTRNLPDIEYAIGAAPLYCHTPSHSGGDPPPPPLVIGFQATVLRRGSEFRIGLTCDKASLTDRQRPTKYTLSDPRLLILSDSGGVYCGSRIAPTVQSFGVGDLVRCLFDPVRWVVRFFVNDDSLGAVDIPWDRNECKPLFLVCCLDAGGDQVVIRPWHGLRCSNTYYWSDE